MPGGKDTKTKQKQKNIKKQTKTKQSNNKQQRKGSVHKEKVHFTKEMLSSQRKGPVHKGTPEDKDSTQTEEVWGGAPQVR